jgi:hypothetical protein
VIDAAGARRLERQLVILIAAHTFLVGAALLFMPGWSTRFGGYGEVVTLFFPRQAGVFHFLLGAGYLVEHHRYGGIRLLLAAKGAAVAFLGFYSVAWGPQVPWMIPFAALGDGVMGLAIWWVRRRGANGA